MRRVEDYYEILGVGYSSNRDEIKRAYTILRDKYRDNADRLAVIREAWGTLGDANLRSKYDSRPDIKARRRASRRHRPGSGGRVSKTQIIPVGTTDSSKTLIIQRPVGNADDGSKTVIRRIHYPPVHIIIKDSNGVVQERFFEQEQITIGRINTQDIVLVNEYVSRKHAQIEIQNAAFYIVDTSTNGTWVNGHKLKRNEPHLLADGDAIDIEKWRLTVHFDQSKER